MNKSILSIIELIYLYYMFIIFKTRFSINHPMELVLTNNLNKLGNTNIFNHKISNNYESKICPFGKKIIYVLLIYLLIRAIYPKLSKKINLIVLLTVLIMSLLNLNALLYIIPYIIIEIKYFI